MNTTLPNRPAKQFTVLVLWALAAILTACARPPISPTITKPAEPATSGEIFWPTSGWRTSTPGEQEMDAGLMSQSKEFIQENDLDFDSLLIARHGYIVSETYFDGFRQDTLHELYSCTKSFVSTLIGIAIDRGFIEGVDQHVLDLFPEGSYENLDTLKEEMTLEDVLTMTAGLDWQEGDTAYRDLYTSGDWVSYMLDRPMVESPGSQFNYCSGCSHLLSAILTQSTGMSTEDFAEKYLFEPLGITDYAWDSDSEGISIGGWGLQLSPRDMAKLGYLYLQEGYWEGEQIVSPDWIERATERLVETGGDLGYGYQWWVYPSHEAYTALGLYGQTIFVAPESDLIVVTTAGSIANHDNILKMIEEYVLPAIIESDQ